MNEITVREGLPGDADRIIGFQKQMAWETERLQLDGAVLHAGVHAVLQDPGKGKYYVAVRDGEVVGSLMTTYEWSDWRNGTIIWLQSVYLSRDVRGSGVFGLMFRHIQALVRDHPGYMGIRLYVDKSNKRAREVYKALGMKDDHYDTFEWMKNR